MHELQSPDQMTHVIIPLLKIDLRTVHGLVNAAVNTKVIASLRHFLPLQVERYVTARSPHINVIAVNVDEVLSKSRLPQIVPSGKPKMAALDGSIFDISFVINLCFCFFIHVMTDGTICGSLDFDNTSSTLTAITLMCGDLAVTYRSLHHAALDLL
jgi:hypothetical protein